jgi:bifunctional non-homologous end joining protein LigD
VHERKAALKKIVAETDVQFSESFEIDGPPVYAHVCKAGYEGVVSKVRDSTYASGRGNSWVKKTCAQREMLTIAGFALDEEKWDGIYVGRRNGDDLVYAGKVDHGFDKGLGRGLTETVKPLIRKTQPYAKRTAHKCIWVEPKLLAEIARSRPPGRSDIRSSRDCARICDHCRSSADMPGTGASWI